jgi:hypothetical protein
LVINPSSVRFPLSSGSPSPFFSMNVVVGDRIAVAQPILPISRTRHSRCLRRSF